MSNIIGLEDSKPVLFYPYPRQSIQVDFWPMDARHFDIIEVGHGSSDDGWTGRVMSRRKGCLALDPYRLATVRMILFARAREMQVVHDLEPCREVLREAGFEVHDS